MPVRLFTGGPRQIRAFCCGHGMMVDVRLLDSDGIELTMAHEAAHLLLRHGVEGAMLKSHSMWAPTRYDMAWVVMMVMGPASRAATLSKGLMIISAAVCASVVMAKLASENRRPFGFHGQAASCQNGE
jgi:hypothetical protein